MRASSTLSLAVAVLTAFVLASSPEPLLTLFAAAVLVAGIHLLWPAHDTPVLLLPFLLQWLSVAIKPFQSAITGLPLDDFGVRGAQLSPAAWFGLLALLALAIGMRTGAATRRPRLFAREMRLDVAHLPQRLVIGAALLALLAGHALDFAAGLAGPARQPVLMLANVKLAGLFVLTYWCVSRGRAFGLLIAVLGFEVISGMTGFFSEFKAILLVAGLAAIAARPRLGGGTLIAGGAAVAGVLLVLVFWSAIKPDYRAFMSDGKPDFAVEQPLGARLGFLAEAAGALDGEDLRQGFTALLGRLAYIDFLAHTLNHTPRFTPHTFGEQTAGAFRHLVPRLVWPGKPLAPHDTIVTARFTGLTFSTLWASISIGYLGELYVDFGYCGALAAMLLIGFAIGSIYRILMAYRGLPTLVNAAVATTAIIPFVYFERALLKLVGGSLTLFIAALLIQRVAIPRVLTWLVAQRARAARRRRPPFREVLAHARTPAPPPGSPPPHAPG